MRAVSKNFERGLSRFPIRFLKVSTMKTSPMKTGVLALCLAFLCLPLISVYGAGGRIEGKVTDPKGAAVAGATVTVTEVATNKTFTAQSDKLGRYKIEGLPAGIYSIVVSAPGFSEARRDQ